MITRLSSLENLFLEQLQELYSAELLLIGALPKFAEACTSPELRTSFDEHYFQTKGQIARLERIFADRGEKLRGQKSLGMAGILREGLNYLEQDLPQGVLETGLISVAQKARHYEIAAYGTARSYAQLLGLKAAARSLSKTLNEEGRGNRYLQRLAPLSAKLNLDYLSNE